MTDDLVNQRQLMWQQDQTTLNVLVDMARLLDNSRWGLKCYCHKHTNHVPQESHHIWPIGLGGPDRVVNQILICANAHSAIHRLLPIMLQAQAINLPIEITREYGYKVRYIAALGFRSSILRVLPPYPLPLKPLPVRM